MVASWATRACITAELPLSAAARMALAGVEAASAGVEAASAVEAASNGAEAASAGAEAEREKEASEKTFLSGKVFWCGVASVGKRAWQR